MSYLNYILRSLRFYKRQHLAVLAGTLISTAVLTGALITGDSIRHSLKKIVDARLGKTEFMLSTADRFVRSTLADDISNRLNVSASSVLMMQGVCSNPENEIRINHAQVIGIDDSFWLLSDDKMPDVKEDEAIISINTAQKLRIRVGEEFVLRVENKGVIPINTPFSAEESPAVTFRLKVVGIADESSLGRFSIKSNQIAPYNVFMHRSQLCNELKMNESANLLLIAGNDTINAEELNKTLEEVWMLEDAGIDVHKIRKTGQYEISSSRIFIDKQISTSILKENPLGESIITYLVNSIKSNDSITPYSFVTALDSLNGDEIAENEIIVNEWLADDLNISPGDTIEIEYYIIEPLQTLKTVRNEFVVKEIIKTKDSIINKSLMPDFPGFSAAMSCVDWNANIPIDLDLIRDKDEDYWKKYKGTPKAVISLKTGTKLWENKFGCYTAIRFANNGLDQDTIKKQVLNSFHPGDLNYTFIPIQKEGIRAAGNGVDFGELFLSLSFFVIVAGIFLTTLLYALNTEKRRHETAVLTSLGYTRKQILRLRLLENSISIFIGGILGSLAGIAFNYGIMTAINSVWNDIVRTNMLEISINSGTLAIGALSGFIISILSIYFVTRKKLKDSVVAIFNNSTQLKRYKRKRQRFIDRFLILIGLFGSISVLTWSLISAVQSAGLFLMAGGLFLLGCYGIIGFLLRGRNSTMKAVSGFTNFAMRNAGRNRNRSMAIVVLLSLGTFVVLITGANRETFHGTQKVVNSGTGGYTWWAETSIPVSYDLNTDYGKSKMGLIDEEVLSEVEFIQFRTLDGNDASCLNLNQVEKPGILGVKPEIFIKRGAFSFAALLPDVDVKNPWDELNKQYDEDVIPAFADQTVITWGLMRKLGDTLNYLNEAGKTIRLVLAGGLNASIFQGNILISDQKLAEHFPSSGGSKLMLIDAPEDSYEEVFNILTYSLKDYGIELDLTSERLGRFYSVTNTYLSVFMILGGLGVLIGTFGLGIVLSRNLIDRKEEIALLLATGFTKQKIFRLVFIENFILILFGIIVGMLSALIGILPSFISQSFDIPESFVFLLIALILLNAVLWIFFPLRKALKGNVINSLRNE